MDYKIAYVGAETVFALLLLTLFFLHRTNSVGKTAGKLDVVFVMFIFSCLLDSAWIVIDGNPSLRLWNILLEAIYFTTNMLISYIWFLYTLDLFPAKAMRIQKYKYILSIPAILAILLILSSVKTNLIFSVDQNGVYARGPLNFVAFLVSYSYMILGSAVAIICRQRAKLTIDKKRFTMASLFPVPIFLMTIVQLFLPPGLPSMQGGAVISLLLVFSISQNVKITRDHLTNLPNRSFFESVLVAELSRPGTGENVHRYLIAGDLDNFKDINDNYGHPFGDKVLIFAAEALKSFFADYNGTVFRTGGDEFMALLESSAPIDADELQIDLNEKLSEITLLDNTKLSMSIGVVEYNEEADLRKLIEAADDKLYAAKNK